MTTSENKNLWYGYVYKPSGDLQVKLFFDMLDIKEAQQMLGYTVSYVTPAPFGADSREDALSILRVRLGQLVKENT